MEVFEGTKELMGRLSRDYVLLAQAYTTFFPYRVKLITVSPAGVTSKIYGEKESTSKVKILFDHNMFYILTKNLETPLFDEPEADLTSVSVPSGTRGNASSDVSLRKVIALLSDERWPNVNSDGEIIQKTNGLNFQLNKVAFDQREDLILQNLDSVSKSQLSMSLGSPEKLRAESSRKSGFNKSDSESLRGTSHMMRFKWRSIAVKKQPDDLFLKEPEIRKDSQEAAGRYQYGVLESYSASSQSGFVVTQDFLQALVSRDELLKAGASESLLDNSASNLFAKAKFALRTLSAEPIPVFEAVDLHFIN